LGGLIKGFGLALFVLLVIAVVPGLALAALVGARERKWRTALEKELAGRDPKGQGPEETPGP
jgi:hypothetical protein